jgi:hypothetical protein
MGFGRFIRRMPGLVSGVRLGRRMVAIARGVRSDKRGWALSGEVEQVALRLEDGRHRFVGYYDHSPLKLDDEDLLPVQSTCHRGWRRPSPDIAVRIEIINHKANKVVRELGETYAWNWQQGARALWLNAETVIFNIYEPVTDRYRARMVNTDGKHLGDLPIPVQELDKEGRIYSLSYEALSAIRPDYGYRNRPVEAAALENNAIEQYDPGSGSQRVLVDVSVMKSEVSSRRDGKITRAKFNHIMASPNASRLVFLFRYFLNGQRVTDLYAMSSEGGNPRLLVGDSGVSHVCWWDDQTLIATMKGAEGFGYYRVPFDSPEDAHCIWAARDGHPSRLGERHVLTDTYPDRHGLRHLLIHSIEKGDTVTLGVFAEPLLFQGGTRCDLHPSLSPSGKYIQVDCAIGHRRTVAVLENPLFNPTHA